MLKLSSVLGFPLYKDTTDGRAATQQVYSFAIDVWFGANGSTRLGEPPPVNLLSWSRGGLVNVYGHNLVLIIKPHVDFHMAVHEYSSKIPHP